MQEIKISISLKSIIFTIAIVLLIIFLILAKDVILFLFASYIISSALFPLIDVLQKKMPLWLVLTLVFLCFVVLTGILFVPFLNIFLQQLEQLREFLPDINSKFTALTNSYQHYAFSFLLPSTEELTNKIFAYSEDFLKTSFDFTLMVFTKIVSLFTLIAMVMFILLDRKTLKTGFLAFFPKNKRDYVDNMTKTISTRVGGYVRGQVAIMILIGIITGIVMQLMGVPFALLLGILAGLLEIIPVIGPILAALPAILLALFVNPWLAVGVIVAYLVIQRAENFITPFVYGKFLNMPPLVIVTAILIAGTTLGILGVVLSPAIVAVMYVFIQELYLKELN